MKPTVAILAGHYGSGTGARYGSRDEYALNRRDALMLYSELARDEVVLPVLEPIEDTAHLKKFSSIEKAAEWAKGQRADVVIECHYNSANGDPSVISGNEIVVPRVGHFERTLDRFMAALPNRHRPMIVSEGMALFKHLPDTRVAIIEPAFLWEPQIETAEWAAQVAVAVKSAVYWYFKEWGHV